MFDLMFGDLTVCTEHARITTSVRKSIHMEYSTAIEDTAFKYKAYRLT